MFFWSGSIEHLGLFSWGEVSSQLKISLNCCLLQLFSTEFLQFVLCWRRENFKDSTYGLSNFMKVSRILIWYFMNVRNAIIIIRKYGIWKRDFQNVGVLWEKMNGINWLQKLASNTFLSKCKFFEKPSVHSHKNRQNITQKIKVNDPSSIA